MVMRDQVDKVNRLQEDGKLWKTIWTMDIKCKLQHFIQCACHNRISVGANLNKRGMEVDGICKHCGKTMETIEHFVFHCAKAKLIWKLAPVRWDSIQQHTFSFKEWWRELANVSNQPSRRERQELTAYLIWHVWKARNSWAYNASKVPEHDVVEIINKCIKPTKHGREKGAHCIPYLACMEITKQLG